MGLTIHVDWILIATFAEVTMGVTAQVDWFRIITPALYLLFFLLLLGVGLSAYLRWFHRRYLQKGERPKPTPTEDVWRQHVAPDLGDLDAEDSTAKR